MKRSLSCACIVVAGFLLSSSAIAAEAVHFDIGLTEDGRLQTKVLYGDEQAFGTSDIDGELVSIVLDALTVQESQFGTREYQTGTGSPQILVSPGWGSAEVLLSCGVADLMISKVVEGVSQTLIVKRVAIEYCP